MIYLHPIPKRRNPRPLSSTPSSDVETAVVTATAFETATAVAVGTGTAKVIQLPTAKAKPDPFQQLTVELVLAQFRAGTLPEAMLLYLLAGAGLLS
jgi:hypothetical protein